MIPTILTFLNWVLSMIRKDVLVILSESSVRTSKNSTAERHTYRQTHTQTQPHNTQTSSQAHFIDRLYNTQLDFTLSINSTFILRQRLNYAKFANLAKNLSTFQ